MDEIVVVIVSKDRKKETKKRVLGLFVKKKKTRKKELNRKWMGIFFFWLKVSRRWRRNLTNKIIGMKLLA